MLEIKLVDERFLLDYYDVIDKEKDIKFRLIVNKQHGKPPETDVLKSAADTLQYIFESMKEYPALKEHYSIKNEGTNLVI